MPSITISYRLDFGLPLYLTVRVIYPRCKSSLGHYGLLHCMNIGTNFSTRIRLADVVFSTTLVSHTSRHAITRLRVRRLQSHGGDEGIDHPARTHYVGKGMELMDPLKAHGNVTGYIHPQRHIVLFTRGPVYRQAGGYVAASFSKTFFAAMTRKKSVSETSPTPSR